MWQEIECWKIHNENYTWGGVGGWVGLNFHSMSGGSVNNFYFGFYDEAKIGSSLCYTSPSSILC